MLHKLNFCLGPKKRKVEIRNHKPFFGTRFQTFDLAPCSGLI